MKNNHKYEILTPMGFSKFNGITKVQKDKYIEIIIPNNSIKCSFDHRFIVDNKEIYAIDLKINDTLDTIDGKDIITNIIIHNDLIDLYDILNVNHNNIFYANDIITHNCDASFVSSGNTVIRGEVLEWYEKAFVEEPTEKRYKDNLWLFDQPNSSKQYIISVDVSRGDGTDYTGFHILDLETLEQVGEYKGKIPTAELPKLLQEVGFEWNTALISIENASMGWGVVQDMIRLEYPNLYYTPKKEITNEYEFLDEDQFTPGFTISSKSRPLIMSKLEDYVNNKLVIIRSIRTIHELKVFIWLNHKPQAASGYNDDLTLSLAEGLYIRDTLRQFNTGNDGFSMFNKNPNAFYDNVKGGYNSRVQNKVQSTQKMDIKNIDKLDPFFDDPQTLIKKKAFQENLYKKHNPNKVIHLPS